MRGMVEGATPSAVRGLCPSTAFGGPPPRFAGEDRAWARDPTCGMRPAYTRVGLPRGCGGGSRLLLAPGPVARHHPDDAHHRRG